VFKSLIRVLIVALVSIPIMLACSGDETEKSPVSISEETSKPKVYDVPPEMLIDTKKDYSAVFEMDKGDEFEIDLYEKLTPVTVNNFVFLAKEGYYDGVTFHRVIEGFMAQGGDPTNGDPGNAGYYFENEFHPDALHDSEGVISMANKAIIDGKGTNGTQFFITFRETHGLDGYDMNGTPKDCSIPGTSCHTVFGKVSNGMNVVKNISIRDPNTASSLGDVIKTIRIIEK
jgi:peptidylprolyl isomerase